MTLIPFLETPVHIQLHAVSAFVAIVAGPVALYGQRGRTHKITGYLWVASMVLVALSSFWITGFGVVGPFSPLHLLSLLVLVSLYQSIAHARAGWIALHQRLMKNLYWTGVVVAGLFNFLPGRMVNRMVFAQMPDMGFVVIGMGGAALVIYLLKPYVAPVQPAK
ncbi:MAG: DUF2306 domain-containing protein [Pelagimonas sp.]|jgi:uncharacterized membrane protein|nr:DUF2306 domain-containing protein [Pelagimonas sp.]